MGMRRTPLTWAYYGVNGAWASFVYLSGPVARILADDMGVSAGTAGLIGTALAVGIATASAVAPAAVRRRGRDGATRIGLLALIAVVAGIAVGRTAGSWTTARLGPHTMLLSGFGLALAGFAILWTSTALPLSILGLFVAGIGLATLFPLVLDRGIVLSDGQPDTAMSRSSLVLGLAIGGAPFLLGALGSVMSVSSAMLLVPLLIVAGLVGVALSRPRAA